TPTARASPLETPRASRIQDWPRRRRLPLRDGTHSNANGLLQAQLNRARSVDRGLFESADGQWRITNPYKLTTELRHRWLVAERRASGTGWSMHDGDHPPSTTPAPTSPLDSPFDPTDSRPAAVRSADPQRAG
ncbi:MAG: hypothetical protein QOJ29_342, partial [Thermoleophilaceae bacterium]|nr:hypothetical protein [Thermoleophilaceae bacterium]